MAKKQRVDEVFWIIRKKTYRCHVLPQECPFCRAWALVALPPPEVKKQSDDTNVVCFPGIGGCNHGFHSDALPARNDDGSFRRKK